MNTSISYETLDSAANGPPNADINLDDNSNKPAPRSNWTDYLPLLLRSLGAAAILVALYTFIVKGWQSSDDLSRYYTLLAHTGLLGIIGLLIGRLIKEAKGARVLFMLALASIPVNFAVLGGLLFSALGVDSGSGIPSYLFWKTQNLSSVVVAIGAAVVTSLPIVYLGFKILIRKASAHASIIFILFNLLLLVPIREPLIIAVASIGLSFLMLSFYQLSAKKMLIFQTFEGKISFAILFSPIAILLGRNLWLYSFDYFLVASCSIALFLFIRQINSNLKENSLMRSILEFISLILIIATAINFNFAVTALGLSKQLSLAFTTFAASGMLFDLSRRGELREAGYRIATAIVLALGTLFTHWMNESVVSSLIMLMSIGLLTWMGVKHRQKAPLLCSTVLFLVLVAHLISQLMFSFNFSYWILIAGAGIVLIVSGSLVEAKSDLIKSKLSNYKHRLAKWQF